MSIYLWYVSTYFDWRTAVSIGLVFVVLPGAGFAVSRFTRNRSS
ncbi:MAG: hypothetical protein ACJ786_31285 [Catenulispora sp.]